MNVFRCDSISIKVSNNFILKDLTFTINEKEITLLFSSFDEAKAILEALYAKRKVESGKIFYVNEDITSFNTNNIEEWRVSDISYISYEDKLFDELTVYDNVTMPVRLNRLPVGEDYIDELLEALSLDEIKDELVKDISYLDFVKVKIARAMASRPFALLIDDVARGISPYELDLVVDSLTHMNNLYHVSIIYATNNEKLKAFASHVLTIEDGIIKDVKSGV